MKKYLLIIGFLLTSFVSFSQVIPKPNPTAVGIGYKRLLADSTIFIPTGGAIPRLGSNNINRRSAIYADTINKRLWVFYPNDSTWKVAGLTKITWDSVTNKPTYFLTKYDSSTDIKDSIQARLALRDTANMLSPYIKIVDVHGLPVGGTTGQILAKIDETDYNTQWIDNYTGDIRQYVKAGEAINKGQAVYVSSADGTNIIVSKASNASESTSSKTLGLLYQTLALNGQGFVITEGRLEGLNTLGATAGDPVWLGTNGNLIFGLANKPYAPAHLVYIGVVSRVNANNGEILVKIQNGFELKELHDVSAQSPSNNDGLFYNSSNSLWETKSIATALGYTPANAATYVPYTGATTGLNMGNNPITTSNFFFGKAIELDAGIEEVGGTVIFRQRTAISGGGANYTTFGAVSNNVLNFSFWQDAPSGINRYKNFQFRTDNLTISTNRIYQMPDASGTLALTSNLSSYVPYTGATGSVNLGAFDISSRYIFSNGNGTASGLISMKIGNTITGVSGYGTIGAASGQQFVFNSFVSGSYSKTAYFNFSGLTDDVVRSYVFPDASGTLALTSDLGSYVTLATNQTISGTKNFSNPAYAEKGVVLLTGSTSFAAGQTTLNGNANGLTIGLGVTVGSTTTSYAHQLLFPQITPRTYTFPAASGTVALTSDLDSYVPYSGATSNVNLGTNQIFSGFAFINGNGSVGGVLGFKQYATSFQATGGYTNLWATGSDKLNFTFAQPSGSGKDFNFDVTNITAGSTRSYIMPNASGTLALTSDLGSYLPLVGGTLTGPLNGTNALFNGTNDQVLTLNSNGSNTQMYFQNNGTLKAKVYLHNPLNQLVLGTYITGGSIRFEVDNNVNALTIGSTGAATFLSSVQSTNMSIGIAPQTDKLFVYNASGTNTGITIQQDGSGDILKANGNSGANRFRIAQGGAATFSNSVTALGGILANGYTQGSSGQNLEIGYISGSNLYAINAINRSSGLYDKLFFIDGQKIIFNSGSGGGVGIGASINPQNLLEVSAAGGSQRIRVGTLQNNNNTARFEAITSATASTANSAWLRVNVGGGFTIGQSSYTKINGDGGNFANISNEAESPFINANGGGNILMGINSTGPYLDGRISTYGPGTMPAACFKNDGNSQFTSSFWNAASGGGTQTLLQFVWGAGASVVGNITSNGTITSYNITSDYRLKQDLKEYNGLELISKIKTYDYQWKIDKSRMYGVIAHELQQVVPYAVTGEKDAKEMQQVDYSKIVPILVKAVQELQQQITDLKTQINKQ